MQQEQYLLSTKHLSRRWNIAPRTLERWRAEGQGPQFIRIGRHIRYRETDILDFEAEQMEASKRRNGLTSQRCIA